MDKLIRAKNNLEFAKELVIKQLAVNGGTAKNNALDFYYVNEAIKLIDLEIKNSTKTTKVAKKEE